MENGQVEIGYGFLPEYRDKGYATETLDTMLKWAFINIYVPEIIAFSHKDNLASKRVIEKCGMKFYKQEFVENVPYDLYYKKI
jgi:RimJ/RimL family protein N-acetyltransferase